MIFLHDARGRGERALAGFVTGLLGRVIDCLAEYGNTSAASIPIALSEAASTGLLRKGSRVLLSAFGAGLTWGAGIVEWEGTA